MNFGKRDLGLLLSDTVGDADTLRFTHDDSELTGPQETLKPKLDPSKKVSIYRAGQVPGWAQEEQRQAAYSDALTAARTKAASKVGRRGQKASTDVEMARLMIEKARMQDDQGMGGQRERREAEVMASSGESDSDSDGPVFGGRSDDEGVEGDVPFSRPRRTAEAEGAGHVSEEEEEDDDAIAARRARVRDRLRARRAAEPEILEVAEEPVKLQERVEESESSEWETDTDASDDEEEGGGQVLKPVFVPKAKRETTLAREQEAKEQEQLELKREAEKEMRMRDTRQLVADVVRREEDMTENHLGDNESEGDAPDDDDGLDEELAYEEWKVRELARVRKDREEREKLAKDAQEILRRRGLTDEERRREDVMMGKGLKQNKDKMKFMQKYYHKGAFYMDDDTVRQEAKDVRQRSYNEPTLEDKFDKAALPAVMQVKKFGRSGQVKWTHLAAEDTTQWDAAWAQETQVQHKMQNKMAGLGDIDAAFKRRKKPQG